MSDSNYIAWGADAPVSKPNPRDPDLPKVDMGGFCFTTEGIVIDATDADLEHDFAPDFEPGDFG